MLDSEHWDMAKTKSVKRHCSRYSAKRPFCFTIQGLWATTLWTQDRTAASKRVLRLSVTGLGFAGAAKHWGGMQQSLEVVKRHRPGRALIDFDPEADAGKGDCGEEVSCELVIAGRDASEVLELVEEASDEVALAVQVIGHRALLPAIPLGRDVWGGGQEPWSAMSLRMVRPSTTTWILVLSPPRERPMA